MVLVMVLVLVLVWLLVEVPMKVRLVGMEVEVREEVHHERIEEEKVIQVVAVLTDLGLVVSLREKLVIRVLVVWPMKQG